MGSDDRYDKEPKIPKLTKENHEKWFRNNKLKLKGKGIFYTIEVTKHAYAWIARHGAGTSTSTANTSQDPAGTVNPTEQASVLGLTSDFERLGGTWNAEKAKEYDKDEAKALFYITNSLLDDDDALADEYETASALWTALKVKYSKTDQLTANNIMTKLQNFTWKDEKDVDYTWAKLKEYRRKIIAAKPAAKGLYNDEALLQIMLRALPESYGSVIDYLDVQTSLTVDEKIAALRTKELRLNDTAEHANVAFPKYRHPNDHRSSDSSMRDRPRSTSPELGPSTGCLHCKGEHWARDCKYKGEIQEFGRKLREKDERAERRAAKSKRPSRNENKKRSDKPVKPTVKTTSRRKHGYAAKNQDSDSGTDNGSSGTDSETSHESTSVETELEDESEEMEVDEVTNPVAAEPSARYHFRTRTQKRKRDTFDDMEDEHRQAKIVKAMLAVLRESRADEDPTTEIPTSTHHHEESAHETIVKAFYTVIVSGNLDVTGRAELSGKAFAATEPSTPTSPSPSNIIRLDLTSLTPSPIPTSSPTPILSPTPIQYHESPDEFVQGGITYVKRAIIARKDFRQGTSHIWKYGLQYIRDSDKKEVYYCHECRVGKSKQELFVINGTSRIRNHLEQKHQIDPQSGIKRKGSVRKSIIDQQKDGAASSIFFWKESVEKFKELLIRWIVYCHIAFFQLENQYFRELLLFLNPALLNHLPKAAKTIRSWVMNAFISKKQQLREDLHHSRSRISISFDLWTQTPQQSID
ncbi:Retrotran-gag-2 domain containing protein [Pyrenophora tritici-repentis]|uniref:Retrotran-gag-2 domain containing protein n=1 Tax=Pyrenophora tritici-repentis TaxID=45151 RepID=A0A922SXA8_9PLEO|nr:Retrotran-gag-2 domain containing protein [Pyrenophora tritici-repentis]